MQERAEAQVQDLSHRGPTNTPFTTSLAGSATSTASRAGSPPQIKTLRDLTQPPATPPPPSPQFPTRRSASAPAAASDSRPRRSRSEEHTSELQSLMRNSYAVFHLNKKIKTPYIIH